ncbi:MULTISPECIES: hypothetical protein [Acidobacteriaceae]|uniref:hypothetical protein n=1 Tax=Acidobacteriaceae TaxID=204434 RepID=UPI00131B5B79|nr:MULTISPECIES: hypothetical protein [Acidobacteriaceae]MDW5265211.1 hypothetical protein [Edaphobacter sp.]
MAIGSSLGQVSSAIQISNALHFDATWWNQVYSEEQQGFIYGYLDCRPSPKTAKASIVDYQNAVTEELRTGKSGDRDAVAKAIQHAAATLKSGDIQGGENYTEPHGFLDGEWWGDFSGSRPLDIALNNKGYVEGYLVCSSIPVTVYTVRRYQSAIDRHYSGGRHSHDKIANVLQPLMKPPTNSQK